MSDPKRHGNQEVTFVLYDQTTVVKMVTKTTTCADVINTLPRQPGRLSVFESVGGVEKELPGKTRILKVWRTQGANSNVQFVIKKSGKLGGNRLFKSILKAKLEAFSRRLSLSSNKKNRIKHAVPSTPARVVTDRPLENRDVKNVPVLSCGGGVTCGQLPVTSTPRRATIAATTRSRINRQAVGDSLTTMKLVFRKAATSNVTVQRGGRVDDMNNIRRRTIVECDFDEYPLHSTPMVAVTGAGKRRAVLQLTSTPKSAQPSKEYNTPSRPRVSAFPGQDGGRIWNQTCVGDSSFDIDTSCESSELDVAFWYPLIPKMSVQPELNGNQWTGTGGARFDYSFDCTFPAMTDSYQAGLCGYGSDGERSGAESDDGFDWQLNC